MLHRRFPSLLPPPPPALSATPLHPHLPFSFSLPALFLSERKDLAGKEAQSIEASGKTKRRPFTAPPLLAVSDVSPGHPEGGQLPGSLFQKGWHAGQGASACDAPALRASSSHTPPQKAGWLLGPCSHHSRSERQSGPGHPMPPPIFASLHTAGIPLNILGSPCCSRELLETSSSPGVPCPGPCSLTHWQSEDVISRAVSVWPAHRLSQKPGRHWQARHLRHSACRRDVGVCIGFSELRGERAGSPQKPRKAQLGPCLEEQVSKGWRRGNPEGQACSQRCWDGSQRTGPLSLRAGPSIATQSPSTSQQKELPTCLGPRPSAWLQFSCLTQHGQPGLCRGAGLDRAAGPS